ncbi:hypothetical protein QVD99_005896 [Batrachochytrium dendrobatidis]|nr:hypothetical protein O5D80_006082 [Batrachochytrium dendrobatidis]KAK5667282.1 hypothetical protein QVD99_005896 [Batrachochytrium dendrobatidis]
MSFRKLSVNILPLKESLSNDKVADMFSRLLQTQPQIEHFVVDKPLDGSIIAFLLQPGEMMASDGYGWMDDDSLTRVTLDNGIEMEIFTRKLGFSPNETCVSIKRSRYRLVANPMLNLVHYLAVPQDAAMKVIPHAIKAMPRASIMTAPQRQQAYVPDSSHAGSGNYAAKRTGDDPHNSSYYARKRPRAQPQARLVSQVKVIEEEKDLSGDELDQGYTRVISLERYKRNHMFIDLLFSPYSASAIRESKQFPGITPEHIQQMKLHLEKSEKDFDDTRNQYLKEIEEINKAATAEWKCIEEIRHVRTAKDLDVLQEKAQRRLGTKLVPKGPTVTIVNLDHSTSPLKTTASTMLMPVKSDHT